MQDLIHWLRDYSAAISKERRAGRYGLDLYNRGASLDAVIRYLDIVDSKTAKLARWRYGCLERWVRDPSTYSLASMNRDFGTCEKKGISMLAGLLLRRLEYSAMERDGEEFHPAGQNARLAVDAERYYRAMYYRDEKSWNLRDTHTCEILQRLMAFKKNARAVVWAHNSPLWGARYTSMGRRNGEINLGQLCRRNFGQGVAICCGTHTGIFAAAHEWDEPVVVMNANPSRSASCEWLAHETGLERFLFDLRRDVCDESLREELRKERLG